MKLLQLPKSKMIKVCVSIAEEVFVQPGDRMGCYRRIRNTSVSLEPKLSQKSIKIPGLLENWKAQKSSVQNKSRMSHSYGFNSTYEDIATSMRYHTTVLELNKKSKVYSINHPENGELDFKSNLILCKTIKFNDKLKNMFLTY